MSTKSPLKLHEDPQTPAAPPAVEALLVPAVVAGRLCGRSGASWWRDLAAKRIVAPVRGRTLWRVQGTPGVG